jgi:hypothetical protein
MAGNTLRLESRSSLALPADLGNTDTFVALQLAFLAVRGAK